MAEPIIDMVNLQRFCDYIIERYKIHLRKDAHQYPVTTNVIFQRHRFINICRKHDTQTKNVIENIVNNDRLSLEDKIINIMMFRGWSLWDTVRFFGGVKTSRELLSNETMKECKKKYEMMVRSNPRRRFFSSAPYIAILKTANYNDAPPVLGVIYMARLAVKRKLPEKILQATSEQEVIDLLKTLPGIASFIAYQMFLDMCYIPEFPFSDENFVVASTRVKFSIRALFTYSDGLSYESCIKYLKNHISELDPDFSNNLKEIMVDLPVDKRYMTLTMMQSALYGFADYLKIIKRR